MGGSLGPNSDHESSTIRTTLLTGRYAFSSRFSTILSLAYKDIASPKDVGGSSAKHIDRGFRGMGDAILLGRYQLNDTPHRSGSQWAALLGARLPTGDANPNHFWKAADGSTILSRDPVLQPGNGTIDPIVGLQWNQPMGRGRSVYASTLYRQTVMLNHYGYRWGSEFQFITGAAVPMGRDFTFVPQFFWESSGRDSDFQPLPGKAAGVVKNTGGDWLYFMPNFRYRNFEVDVQVPIYRRTNGNILNPNLVLGVRTNFDLPTSGARGRSITPRDGDFRVISRGERIDLAPCAVKNKITLFEFACNCAACKQLTPKLNALLTQRPDIAVRQIDLSNPKAPAREQYAALPAMPCFVLIAKDGARVNDQPYGFAKVEEYLEQQIEADNQQLSSSVPVISRGDKVELAEQLAPGKITVFQFFTPTCETSRSVAPTLRYLTETDSNLTVKRIDVSDDNSAVVAQHHIKVTPTFVVFGRDGRLVGRLESADAAALTRLLSKARS